MRTQWHQPTPWPPHTWTCPSRSGLSLPLRHSSAQMGAASQLDDSPVSSRLGPLLPILCTIFYKFCNHGIMPPPTGRENSDLFCFFFSFLFFFSRSAYRYWFYYCCFCFFRIPFFLFENSTILRRRQSSNSRERSRKNDANDDAKEQGRMRKK